MERGDIESRESASSLTRRLETFIATAVRIWNEDERLAWATVLVNAKLELGIDDQDKVVQDLVGRLAYRGDPRDEIDLVGKAVLAVRQAVERKFGQPAAGRRRVEGEQETLYKYGDDRDSERQRLRQRQHERRNEQERERREQREQVEQRERRRLRERGDERERELREHREQRERHIVAPPAAMSDTVHAAIASIRVPQTQPLSGQHANEQLATGVDNFTITGFKSVSPPEQIPFEYQVGGETFTGMATADKDSQLHISTTLKFCTKVYARTHKMDRVCADFNVSFDRQVYYVIDQAHGEINRAELPRPRRFANLTLGLTSASKLLLDDLVILDLSVKTERNTLGAIVYYIHWTWSGHLYRLGGPKEVDRHGAIKLQPNGKMIAEDAATKKYFNL